MPSPKGLGRCIAPWLAFAAHWWESGWHHPGRHRLRPATDSCVLACLTAIICVTDMLEPLDRLAVEGFLDRQMRHRRGRRGAMPVLFPRGKPDGVAGTDLLDRSALALRQPQAGDDEQRLTERMGVPGSAGAGLEGDQRGAQTRRLRR